MFHSRLKARGSSCLCVAAACLLLSAQAEPFTISIGSTVSPGSPGPGAGAIETVTSDDIYSFVATNGQIIFLEELSVAAAFQGWLYWDLKAPSGASLMSAYFEGTHEGRRVLPETGTYSLRVRVLSTTPSLVGPYSFRVRAVPPDDTFAIQIGDTISSNTPAPGAGNLEVPGANDLYQFSATAGQLAWFEKISAAAAFQGWLQWELRAPSGQLLFRSYFANSHEGRHALPETGTYSLRFSVGGNSTTLLGQYAFRIWPIPPDQSFPIAIGQTVSNALPASGAGNIETPGAQDFYTFQGAAGQNVFFENLAAAPAFAGWLKWETRTPSGQVLFSTYLTGGAAVGRKTLPETGTYSIRCWAAADNPAYVGAYAFRLLPIADSQFAIQIGDLITNGLPALGAGYIEVAGGQDLYTFDGLAGQTVRFTEISAAPAFAGWLRWELLSPSSNQVAIAFFQPGREQLLTLPQTGAYKLRVFVGASNPSYIGAYALRTCCDVVANFDQFTVLPATTLQIPKSKFTCNDSAQAGDLLQVDLPAFSSAQGGTLAATSDLVLYAPPAGFVGVDSFTYRLRGRWGGESLAAVRVRVDPAAEAFASVVSLFRTGPSALEFCLLGLPGQLYQVEQSTNLQQWTVTGSLTADASGSMIYQELNTAEPARFYRFRKQ